MRMRLRNRKAFLWNSYIGHPLQTYSAFSGTPAILGTESASTFNVRSMEEMRKKNLLTNGGGFDCPYKDVRFRGAFPDSSEITD